MSTLFLDAFGLFSLSDACLKVGATEEIEEPMSNECKRRRLEEKADDIQTRIRALEAEEKTLRSKAAALIDQQDDKSLVTLIADDTYVPEVTI